MQTKTHTMSRTWRAAFLALFALGLFFMLTTTAFAASAKSVKASPSKFTLLDSYGKRLAVSVSPANAKTKLKFTTSNKKVARVSQQGWVRAAAPGTAYITVKTSNGKSSRVKVHVNPYVKVTKVNVSALNMSLVTGDSAYLKTSVSPANASEKRLRSR